MARQFRIPRHKTTLYVPVVDWREVDRLADKAGLSQNAYMLLALRAQVERDQRAEDRVRKSA